MLSFIKMNGLGNDFVIVDSRSVPISLSQESIILLSNRKFGVGCDQFIILEKTGCADVFMRIYNADGSEVGACGNATRCVASLIMEEEAKDQADVETIDGVLHCVRALDGDVSVDMGVPKLDWREIPVSEQCNTLELPLDIDGLAMPVGVSMGNPHAVFFVDDLSLVNVEKIGAQVEVHPLFPERVNVSFAQVISPAEIKLVVFERGVGVTLACGTGACATHVAAVRRGLINKKSKIVQVGGDLEIRWGESGDHVHMKGGATKLFDGVWNQQL